MSQAATLSPAAARPGHIPVLSHVANFKASGDTGSISSGFVSGALLRITATMRDIILARREQPREDLIRLGGHVIGLDSLRLLRDV